MFTFPKPERRSTPCCGIVSRAAGWKTLRAPACMEAACLVPNRRTGRPITRTARNPLGSGSRRYRATARWTARPPALNFTVTTPILGVASNGTRWPCFAIHRNGSNHTLSGCGCTERRREADSASRKSCKSQARWSLRQESRIRACTQQTMRRLLWTKPSTSCGASTSGGASRIIGTHRCACFTASSAGTPGRAKPKTAGLPPPRGWRTSRNSRRPYRRNNTDRPSFPIARRTSRNAFPTSSCSITTRSCPSSVGGLSPVAVAIRCHRDKHDINLRCYINLID